ncbi:MAG: HDIG domain-containing protein [Bacteroidales bacterium]|nr:HDIG domain-containing protein [Bacteroidales bacterium]
MNNKNKLIVTILLFAISIAVSVFIFPTENQFEYSYNKGTQWLYDDLYAPYDFAICRSQDDIQYEKDSIVADFIPYYSFDTVAPKKFVSTYCSLLDKVSHDKMKVDSDVASDFCEVIKNKLVSIFNKGVILPDASSNYPNAGNRIRIVRNNISELELIGDFYTKESAKSEIKDMYYGCGSIYMADSLSGFSVRDLIDNTEFVTNIAIDESLNELYLQSQLEDVSPMSGMVHKGDLIISKGKVVDEHSKRLLDSYKMQFENTTGRKSFWLVELGVSLVFLILFAIILYYSLKFGRLKKWGIKENVFVLSQMLVLFLVAFLVFKYTSVSINIVPFVLVPLLFVTFIGFDISFLIYLITILIVSFFAANRFEFVFIQTITGLVGMFSLRNTSKRQQIFISMIIVFITYSLLHTGFSLMRLGTFSEQELEEFIYYGISSALLLLYLPFVFIFEKIFGFISGFTLVELCDTNNPALRELSEKAPGTFQHSVMLSNLAESIVREIGGKPLLARAGALYHDIGKTYAPEFFIENQNGGKNVHNDMPYEESAQRIIAHVSMGIEFAKKYKLPDQIIDFIEQHHGTSVTRYFYNSWVNANPDKTPDITKFQYAGPKPQSVELIATMMADAVEAASRTLKVYSHESISALVNGIVDSQFRDGQYEDVDITMKQIGKAKQILIAKIENIYHSRIEYPELEKNAKQ